MKATERESSNLLTIFYTKKINNRTPLKMSGLSSVKHLVNNLLRKSTISMLMEIKLQICQT